MRRLKPKQGTKCLCNPNCNLLLGGTGSAKRCRDISCSNFLHKDHSELVIQGFIGTCHHCRSEVEPALNKIISSTDITFLASDAETASRAKEELARDTETASDARDVISVNDIILFRREILFDNTTFKSVVIEIPGPNGNPFKAAIQQTLIEGSTKLAKCVDGELPVFRDMADFTYCPGISDWKNWIENAENAEKSIPLISKPNKNYGFEIKGIDDAEGESSDDDANDYFQEFTEFKSKKFKFEYPADMRDTPLPISIVKQAVSFHLQGVLPCNATAVSPIEANRNFKKELKGKRKALRANKRNLSARIIQKLCLRILYRKKKLIRKLKNSARIIQQLFIGILYRKKIAIRNERWMFEFIESEEKKAEALTRGQNVEQTKLSAANTLIKKTSTTITARIPLTGIDKSKLTYDFAVLQITPIMESSYQGYRPVSNFYGVHPSKRTSGEKITHKLRADLYLSNFGTDDYLFVWFDIAESLILIEELKGNFLEALRTTELVILLEEMPRLTSHINDASNFDMDEKAKADKDAEDKETADKEAADKVKADKKAEDKVKADKEAADKEAADKVKADKEAEDKVKADMEAAFKARADKYAAVKAEKEAAGNAKANTEAALEALRTTELVILLEEMPRLTSPINDASNFDMDEKAKADKKAEDKETADKEAADKVKADKKAEDKVKADKEAADKEAADKVKADKEARDKVKADTEAAFKARADKFSAVNAASKETADKPKPEKPKADENLKADEKANKVAAVKAKQDAKKAKADKAAAENSKKAAKANDEGDLLNLEEIAQFKPYRAKTPMVRYCDESYPNKKVDTKAELNAKKKVDTKTELNAKKKVDAEKKRKKEDHPPIKQDANKKRRKNTPIKEETIIVTPGPSAPVQQGSYSDRDQIKFLTEHIASENTHLREQTYKLMTIDSLKSSVNTAPQDNFNTMSNLVYHSWSSYKTTSSSSKEG